MSAVHEEVLAANQLTLKALGKKRSYQCHPDDALRFSPVWMPALTLLSLRDLLKGMLM